MYRATSKGKIPSVVKNAKSMAQIKTVSQSQPQQHFPPGSAGTIGSSSTETATTTESYRPTSQRLANVDSFHMFKHSTTALNATSNSNTNNNKSITNKTTNSNNTSSSVSNIKAASPTTLRYANLTGSALSPLNKKNSISSINLQNSGNKSSNTINRSMHNQNPNNKSKNGISISSSSQNAVNAVEPFALVDQQQGGNTQLLSNSQAATKVARLNLFDEQPNGQGIILEGNKGNNNSISNDATKGKDIQKEEEINVNKKQNIQAQQQDYPTTKRVSVQRGGSNEVSESADGIDGRQERNSYMNNNNNNNNNNKEEHNTDRQPSSSNSGANQKSQPPPPLMKTRGQDSNGNNTPNGQRDAKDRKDPRDIKDNQLLEERDNNNKQNTKNNNNGCQQPYNPNAKYPYDQSNNRSQGSYPPQDYEHNTNWGQSQQQYERNRSNNERNPQQYRDNTSYQSDRFYPPMNGNPRYYNDHPNNYDRNGQQQQYHDTRSIPYNDRSGQYYPDRSSGGYEDIPPPPPLPPQGMPFYNGNGHEKRNYQNSYHDKGGYFYDRNNYGYQGYPPPPLDGGYYRHPHDRDGYYYDRDGNNGRANINNDWYAHDRMGNYDPRNQMKQQQQRYKNSSSDFDEFGYRCDQFSGPINGGSFQNDGFRSQNPQDRRIIDRNTNKTPPNEMRYVSECYPRMDDTANTSDRWRPSNAMSYDQFKQQSSLMGVNNSNHQQNGSSTSSPAPPLSHSQNNRASRGEQQPSSQQQQQYPQYYMDKGYLRHNNDNTNYNNANITDQKILPPQSLPDRQLNKSANGFNEHHRQTPSGGSNYRPGQSPNQRYQGEYEYQYNNWINNNGNSQQHSNQQPYIQGRDKSPGTRFPPGERERTTPTGASTNTDRVHSQQFSKREQQQQQQQDDSVNFKNRQSFQDYTNNNNNPTGKQAGGAGGSAANTANSRYQQQPDYASFQRRDQGQFAKEYMDLIGKNNNSIQDEPSSQPSKDTQGNTKRSFLKEMPENKPQEQPQQQLKEGGGGRTNSAASALENIKARGNLKSSNDDNGQMIAQKGIGKQQSQNFDDIPVKGMKAGMNFDDMPIKGGKKNPQQNFDDIPIKVGKEQPQSYDDIPIKANNNNKNANYNRNLSQNFDDTPINGAKNNNKNNYDDMPIKGSSKQQQYNDQQSTNYKESSNPSRTAAGNQSGFQSERNTPNNQKLTGKAQALGKRRLETDDGWEGVGDEQAVEEGVGMNNRQVYSREVKTLQSNYDTNDDRPIKPSNQGGKYDLKGISQQQQQPQQSFNKNSQMNSQATKGGLSQQKMDPNALPIPNKKVKLFECREGCGRSFAEESLAKHEGICKKVFQQKRKKFDSAAMRTDIEELKEFQNSYAGTASKKNNPAKNTNTKASENGNQKAKWQKQSEALRAVINANKAGAEQSQQQADPKARALMNEALFGEEYVQCNFCNRRFNATAAKRHIPFCEKKAKENHGKVVKDNNNNVKGSSSNSSNIAGNNGNKINSNNNNNSSSVVGVANKLQDKGGRKESNIIQATSNNNNTNMNVPRRNIAMNDRRQQY